MRYSVTILTTIKHTSPALYQNDPAPLTGLYLQHARAQRTASTVPRKWSAVLYAFTRSIALRMKGQMSVPNLKAEISSNLVKPFSKASIIVHNIPDARKMSPYAWTARTYSSHIRWNWRSLVCWRWESYNKDGKRTRGGDRRAVGAGQMKRWRL